MVRRTDRPLRIVRVSFEGTRFSTQHLIDAYTCIVPTVRRMRAAATRGGVGPAQAQVTTRKRRGKA
jgi:hypothetical protein